MTFTGAVALVARDAEFKTRRHVPARLWPLRMDGAAAVRSNVGVQRNAPRISVPGPAHAQLVSVEGFGQLPGNRILACRIRFAPVHRYAERGAACAAGQAGVGKFRVHAGNYSVTSGLCVTSVSCGTMGPKEEIPMEIQKIQLIVGAAGAVAVTAFMVRNLLSMRDQIRSLRLEEGGVFVAAKTLYLNVAVLYLLGYLVCIWLALAEDSSGGVIMIIAAFTLVSASALAVKPTAMIRFDDSGYRAITHTGALVQAGWEQVEATTQRVLFSFTSIAAKGQPTIGFRHDWTNADKLYARLRELPESKLSGVFP